MVYHYLISFINVCNFLFKPEEFLLINVSTKGNFFVQTQVSPGNTGFERAQDLKYKHKETVSMNC